MHPRIGDDGEFEEDIDPAYSVYELSRLERLLRRVPRAAWWVVFWLGLIVLLAIAGVFSLER